MKLKLLLLGIFLISLTSCARFDKETMTFYGYGRYKDKDVEIESKPLFSDLVNISGIRQ